MNTAIGILSIVVAFALLIVLSYKGMSVMYVAPLCALFVALVNGIPLLDAITGPFIGGTTAATTFDTLPFQGAIIIMLNMADLKHKDGYPPIMMCTVVWTLVASLVAAALFALFPSLA